MKDRQQYLDKISICQGAIDILTNWEAKSLAEMPQDAVGSALTKIKLAQEMIDLTSYYIVMSEVSMSMLKTRNEAALTNGRKTVMKALSYMENVVSPYLDTPVSDYQDKLDLIESVSASERYFLVRKMGLVIDLLEDAFGDNSRWKWAFIDFKAQCAVIAKNFFDMKNAVSNMSLNSANYESTVYHLRLIKKLFPSIADYYREKYEIAGNIASDLIRAIEFLSAIRRIHVIFGENEDAEIIKKKVNIWQSRLDADIKAKEKAELNNSSR
ncbi:MAG: hypothetical protein LBG05_06205 [Treponema sp.]|jgi:hypothetical protein|nr:hypothetical protein [Treponema sp.]